MNKKNVRSRIHTVPVRHFWNPRTGLGGGMIAAGVTGIVAVIVLLLVRGCA